MYKVKMRFLRTNRTPYRGIAATKKCLNQDFHKIYKITKITKITKIFLLLNPANLENLNKILVQDKKHRELFTRC